MCSYWGKGRSNRRDELSLKPLSLNQTEKITYEPFISSSSERRIYLIFPTYYACVFLFMCLCPCVCSGKCPGDGNTEELWDLLRGLPRWVWRLFREHQLDRFHHVKSASVRRFVLKKGNKELYKDSKNQPCHPSSLSNKFIGGHKSFGNTVSKNKKKGKRKRKDVKARVGLSLPEVKEWFNHLRDCNEM